MKDKKSGNKRPLGDGKRENFENSGFNCVFSSEIDQFARRTYQANFGNAVAVPVAYEIARALT